MSRTVENHDDGSRTERESNGSSTTYNSDDTVRETSEITSSAPLNGVPILELFGGQRDQVTTRDGDGKVINVQPRGR